MGSRKTKQKTQTNAEIKHKLIVKPCKWSLLEVKLRSYIERLRKTGKMFFNKEVKLKESILQINVFDV